MRLKQGNIIDDHVRQTIDAWSGRSDARVRVRTSENWFSPQKHLILKNVVHFQHCAQA